MFEWSRYKCKHCGSTYVLISPTEREIKQGALKCRVCGTKVSLDSEGKSQGWKQCSGCGTYVVFSPEARADLLSPRCIHCGWKTLYKLRPLRPKVVRAI